MTSSPRSVVGDTVSGTVAERIRVTVSEVLLGVLLPVALIAIILYADVIEGPKTAYVGVLTAIPIFSAVFARPSLTAAVGVATWTSAFVFGHIAADGNASAQTVRLVIIAIGAVLAVVASWIRVRRDRQLGEALVAAAQSEVLRERAATDQLTGLRNRRGVLEGIDALGEVHMSVVIIDVDRLKSVNDDYGHLAGDDYLRAIASRLSSNVARTDVVGRWGGDEFIIALAVDLATAATIMRRVVDAVIATPIVFGDDAVVPGISVGIAERPIGVSFDDALKAADAAMYESKRAGSNRVTVGHG